MADCKDRIVCSLNWDGSHVSYHLRWDGANRWSGATIRKIAGATASIGTTFLAAGNLIRGSVTVSFQTGREQGKTYQTRLVPVDFAACAAAWDEVTIAGAAPGSVILSP